MEVSRRKKQIRNLNLLAGEEKAILYLQYINITCVYLIFTLIRAHHMTIKTKKLPTFLSQQSAT
jgi:hypothetical protein